MAAKQDGLLLSEIEQWVRSTNFIMHYFSRLKAERSEPAKILHIERGDDFEPKIVLEESNIRIDNIIISTVHKPLTKKLFEVFLSAPENKQTKLDLMQRIYNESEYSDRSERYRIAMQQNLVKLISRARKLVHESTAQDPNLSHLEWFWFDASLEAWRLYKVIRPNC
jgi:hypothetical protein